MDDADIGSFFCFLALSRWLGKNDWGGRFLVSKDIPREAQPEELVQGGQAGHREGLCAIMRCHES